MPTPSKLTPETQDRICQLVRAGNTIEISAAAVGISEATFYSWMARGTRKGKGTKPYREFRAAIEISRAEAEAVLVSRIAKAAQNGSWSAAAWLLERGAPERWAKPSERQRGNSNEAEEEKTPAETIRDELAARRKVAGK